MNNTEIKSKLTDIFRNVFGDYQLQIEESMTAQDVEKWTSLTHLTMIDTVENEFEIKFKLKEILKLKNVGDLIQLIETKTSDQ